MMGSNSRAIKTNMAATKYKYNSQSFLHSFFRLGCIAPLCFPLLLFFSLPIYSLSLSLSLYLSPSLSLAISTHFLCTSLPLSPFNLPLRLLFLVNSLIQTICAMLLLKKPFNSQAQSSAFVYAIDIWAKYAMCRPSTQ